MPSFLFQYLILIDQNAHEEAEALKQEIEEGLKWVELSWTELEFAFSQTS